MTCYYLVLRLHCNRTTKCAVQLSQHYTKLCRIEFLTRSYGTLGKNLSRKIRHVDLKKILLSDGPVDFIVIILVIIVNYSFGSQSIRIHIETFKMPSIEFRFQDRSIDSSLLKIRSSTTGYLPSTRRVVQRMCLRV